MPFPVVLLMLSALAGAPAATYWVFGAARDLERTQIGIDNLLIRLGERQIEIYRRLIAGNHAVQILEIAHHAAHLCARVPNPAVQCLAHDRQLERELQALHDSTGQAAQTAWAWARAEALSAAPPETRVAAPVVLPLAATRCAVCGRQVFWSAKEVPLTAASAIGRPAEGSLVVFGSAPLRRDDWNYRLKEEEL